MAKKAKITKRYTNLYVKRRLVQLEVDVFGIVSEGVLARRGKYVIMTRIKHRIQDIAVQLELDQLEMDTLWAQSLSLYTTVVKNSSVQLHKLRSNPDQELKKEAVYTAIRPMVIQNSFLRDANVVTKLYEQRKKEVQIQELLDFAASGESPSPFFLCSSHPKAAKDHEPYQGKMYFDEDWEKNSSYSDADRASIRAYIRNHKLRSLQWVTGAPVYMTMRPNCKHYFTNIPLQEVLHASARSLLKKHGMIDPDELPASEQRLNYRAYYNRLKIEKELSKHVECPKLIQDMNRDSRKLIDKWS